MYIYIYIYDHIYIYIERERDVCIYLSLSLSLSLYIYIYPPFEVWDNERWAESRVLFLTQIGVWYPQGKFSAAGPDPAEILLRMIIMIRGRNMIIVAVVVMIIITITMITTIITTMRYYNCMTHKGWCDRRDLGIIIIIISSSSSSSRIVSSISTISTSIIRSPADMERQMGSYILLYFTRLDQTMISACSVCSNRAHAESMSTNMRHQQDVCFLYDITQYHMT